MEIDDAALMFKGWADDLIERERLARTMVLHICEVVNKSFGGKGAWKGIMKGWKLPGDSKPVNPAHLELLKKFKEYDLKHGIKHGKR